MFPPVWSGIKPTMRCKFTGFQRMIYARFCGCLTTTNNPNYFGQHWNTIVHSFKHQAAAELDHVSVYSSFPWTSPQCCPLTNWPLIRGCFWSWRQQRILPASSMGCLRVQTGVKENPIAHPERSRDKRILSQVHLQKQVFFLVNQMHTFRHFGCRF